MVIVTTGTTGFIGQRVLSLLSTNFPKKNILCLIKNSTEKEEVRGQVLHKKLGIKTKKVDLQKGEGLTNLPQIPDVVIHMAANTNTSMRDHRVNDIGTINLTKAFKELGPKTHLIYTSTTAHSGGRKDCSEPIDEATEPFPTNEYGRTKLNAENYLIKECKRQKFRLTILRLNTVYGKNARPNSMFMLMKEMIKSSAFPARLNWPGLTSIIHVDDVAKAIVELISLRPYPGKPQIFVVYSESLTLQDISKIMHSKMKKKYKPITLPLKLWSLGAYGKRYIPYLENILPIKLYNLVWRSGLIVDNSVYCESKKLSKKLKNWRPKKLFEINNF